MALETLVDARTGRKCYLDHPGDLAADDEYLVDLVEHVFKRFGPKRIRFL